MSRAQDKINCIKINAKCIDFTGLLMINSRYGL